MRTLCEGILPFAFVKVEQVQLARRKHGDGFRSAEHCNSLMIGANSSFNTPRFYVWTSSLN